MEKWSSPVDKDNRESEQMSVPARNTKGDNNNLKSEQKLKQTLRQLLELIANFKSHDDPDFEQTLKPLRNIEENDDPDFDSPMPREVLTALIENYERQAQWSSDAGRFRIAEEHQRHMIEHAEEWNAFYEPPRDIARMKKKWKRLIQRQETLGELTNDGRIFQDALPFRRNDRREIYPPSPTRNIPKQSDLDAWIIISRSESFLNLAKDLYQEYLNGGRSRALYQSYLYAKESFKYRFYLKHLPDSGFQQSVELLILVNSHLKRHIEAETYRNMFLQAHKLSSTPGSETTIAPHSPNSSQDQLPLSSRQLQAQSQQLSSPPTTSAFRQSSKPLIDLEATDPMTHYPILISAILSRSLDSVDLLPRRSINANLVFNGRTALMYATHAGSYVNVTKLQSWGADIDQCEPAATGRTALHYAIELRAAEMVVALLEHGAGIEKRYNPETSQQGNGYVEEWVTPLLLAAQLKSPEITGILIDYGAHVGATDLNGRTALHLAVACREGQKQGADCAKLLLRAGADPNFQCAESLHTPLHDSVFYQNEASVRCLLERVGLLDLEVENCVGRTATSLAASMGLYNLLEMLLREGAQIPKLKQQRTKQWPVNVDISIKKTEKERKRNIRSKPILLQQKPDITNHKAGNHKETPASDETKYITPTSVDSTYPKRFVSELTCYLFHALQSELLNLHLTERIYNIVGNLLKDFASTWDLDAQTQLERDAMYYVSRHSNAIVENLRKQVSENIPGGSHELTRSRIGPEASDEYVLNWIDCQGEAEHYEKLDHTAVDTSVMKNNPLENVQGALDLPNFCTIATGRAACQWLVATLRKTLFLDTENSSCGESIQQMIHSCLPNSPAIIRGENARPWEVTISVEWDPRRFLRGQEYQDIPHVAIEKAITLTGSTDRAQALTSTQYMCQTWPRTGKQILRLVADVVNGPDGERHSRSLIDGTRVIAWLGNMHLNVDVCGSRVSISEVAEEVIWLAAALRSSPFDHGVACCTPILYHTSFDELYVSTAHPTLRCKFESRLTKLREGFSSNGKCWYSMFRNPVLVEGFPILRRSTETMGLEIPLKMMAALVDTRRLDEYSEKTFIKGFSAMLIPTRHLGELLVWHVVYNNDGTHISYSDARTSQAMSGIHGVEHMRHIVGWCSEADFLAGDPEASYDVKRTDLPSPGADCALQNVSISCGKIITGGASFAIGNKDKPIQLTKGGYVPKLEWIHEKFFVFWDERAKRGWLVNGSSALLHLLRAALKRKENGPFRSLLLYKAGSISEAAERRTTESAIRVLTNEDNLRLKIYRDKTEFDQKTVRKGAGEPELISEEKESFFYMQDLVEDIYNVLEKMITHQADVASKNGLSLKCRLRKHIDGWSFNDIIENRDCKPGVVTLQSMGKGWVDLLDDLGAITLYGEDFGELIRPTDTERHCARWSLMPSGNYFLAACMSDIVSIIAAHGNSATEPMKVTSNLAWQNWEKRFELCKCGTTGQLRHSNLAQRLQSSNNKYPARSKSGPLKLHGAIVFSHNTELTLLRGEDTVSSSQKTLGPLDMPKPVTRDSGLGSSRDQSSREDNIEDSSSSSQLHTEARYQGAESTTPGGSVLHNSSPSQGLSNAYSPSEPISGGFAGSEKPWERIKSRLPRFKRSFLKQS